MKHLYKKAIFIFRRDLRLEDNTGLIFALKNAENVIPVFIFTPEQIDQNPYLSEHCLRFMQECLQDLDDQLKEKGARLYYFKGEPEKVVGELIKSQQADALIVNRDYTPYSHQRDAKLKKVCHVHDIPFQAFDDALLQPPEVTVKADGSPYSIFTPFFKNASKNPVQKPEANIYDNYFKGDMPFSIVPPAMTKVENSLTGGRAAGLKILKKIGELGEYEVMRDFPAEDYCSHLSAYLKFTVCSPREVYWQISKNLGNPHALIRSLYWRDFFTSIAFFYPYVFEGCFHRKFDRLKWSEDEKSFKRWCQGNTGFPIVDAGMREMNQTGFMHNRVRMIAASFLVKDLHIDWRWGERYFAQTLVDYDPAVNNGNWQWVASTGCDAQPYFRIFNPWSQQKRFDPDCVYIKKWISELKELPSKAIHTWYEGKHWSECPDYPEPMLDHTKAAKEILETYRSLG